VTTLLAGVSLAGMSPAMTVQGGTDTAVFATYLEHVLAPQPGAGDEIERPPGRRTRASGGCTTPAGGHGRARISGHGPGPAFRPRADRT
jgi:hypothetical protein